MPCPVVESSRIIGKKWSVAILAEISSGKFEGFNRFLCSAAGITPRMLSMRLQELERAGLIKRRANGKKKIYSITQKGSEIQAIITDIKKWNVRWGNVPAYCLSTACTECAQARK